MKKLIIQIGLLIAICGALQGQQLIDSLTTPAANHDTMICHPGLSPGLYFADYSDLDGDIYICVGPDVGDGKPVFYAFGSADSLLCDYSVPRMIEGNAVRRKGFQIAYTWESTCFRIWNVGATADSTVYIYKYQYNP